LRRRRRRPPDPGRRRPTALSAERYAEKYLRANLEERLRNLGTDRIDLLQLHTWTRAWNRNPEPFEVLRKLKEEGKIRFVGVSTPEHDQNSVIDLMRGGWVDVVQVIYNIFEQEPAAELLPAAAETGVGVIVRVVFDEGALTGKWTRETRFPEGDFRRSYFEGDRLGRSVERAAKGRRRRSGQRLHASPGGDQVCAGSPRRGHRDPGHAESARRPRPTALVSGLAPLPEDLLSRLHGHNWLRGFWYSGK
jgi:aryl-alcohol dehydrogenase-like predicted oxidoreductase